MYDNRQEPIQSERLSLPPEVIGGKAVYIYIYMIDANGGKDARRLMETPKRRDQAFGTKRTHAATSARIHAARSSRHHEKNSWSKLSRMTVGLICEMEVWMTDSLPI